MPVKAIVVGMCWLTAVGLAAAEIDFAHEIAPLLKRQCGKCHTGTQKKGGLSLNTRESLIAGGESGPAAVAGKSAGSDLIARITSGDKDLRMPPEGEPLAAKEVALLQRWIDEGLKWEAGFSFGERGYEPPLKPRRPNLPPATAGSEHPLDRILDAYLTAKKAPRSKPLGDAAFARRVHLDLIGLLPTPEQLERFTHDTDPQKREKLVRTLLARDVDYAEHWLSFWNDLLRNDYTGTGFITGGRKQISKWLYESLAANKPYDVLVRELIAPPSAESSGFIDGIRWRGEVSAGQTVEIQFAQSVGQSLLGINLKCASCHDSFIDRWTLEEAYGLAAIYSDKPLELHRCDKPVGKTAKPAWLFPELGQVDAKAPRPQRMKQLAELVTHPENGRFARTIVNRLWQRLMGRGIVHPIDAMQTEPWNADLLDYLAVRLVDDKYDLKAVLELIATSQAYQSEAEIVVQDADADGYQFAGPRAKRMTAEQFLDCVWQLTDTAPPRIDAPVVRGKTDPAAAADQPLTAKWIWTKADTADSPAGETVAFRRTWDLKTIPADAVAAITCDNSFSLFVNGKLVVRGDNWEEPVAASLVPHLKPGVNEVLLVAKNGGAGPNPAGVIFEARGTLEGKPLSLTTDAAWQWTKAAVDNKGKFKTPPEDWQPAVLIANPDVWHPRVAPKLAELLQRGTSAGKLMVRASLMKNNPLMLSLGRPNRDQIVSVRPTELTTLEAMDLANGAVLADTLRRGGKTLTARSQSPDELVTRLFRFALSRDPAADELQTLREALGDKLTESAVEDVLWTVIMLPEFQTVR